MAAEVPLLRSSVLLDGFVHGFSTRVGGISEGPYAWLNLGAKWGDDPARVRENRRRFFRAAGIDGVLSLSQVHGAEVTVIDAALATDPEAVARTRADALVTELPGIAIAVYTADCVPVLLADPVRGALAAVHAGWRGMVAGVIGAAVATLGRAFGSRPADLRAALGPSIGPCCFEVGDEVAVQFSPAFVKPGAPSRGRPVVDLRAAARDSLLTAGVPAGQIDADPPCTACDASRFYSFRRDGRETGQHVAFMARRA